MATTKVVTDKVRFSYVQVFEPSAMDEGSKEKYSVSIIIPKSNTKLIKRINDAVALAAEEGAVKHFGGKIPKNYKQPLRDGDDDRPDDPAYADSMFFNANSYNKPGLVDADLNKIMDRSEFYSGCYGRASINFYAYSGKSKGVAAGLNNLQKLEDGESLGGASASAEDDFGDDLM